MSTTDNGPTTAEMITINGTEYRKFIPFPGPVDDGTLRCICCGQIDEEEYHDHDICLAARSAHVDAMLAARKGGAA